MKKLAIGDNGIKQYRIWRFKLKSEVEKMGRVGAPMYEGLQKSYNPETKEVTLIIDWRKNMEKAQREKRPWNPEGEERTFKEDELVIFDRYIVTHLHIGGKR